MKQVIFLGFHCQIYKKAPTARIYVGDVMIDEIEIPEYCPKEYIKEGKLSYLTNPYMDYKKLKSEVNTSPMELNPMLYEKTHSLDSYWWQKEIDISYFTFEELCLKLDPQYRTKEKIQHPKIFVYIIDDKILQMSQNKLRIEINNSDSNYSNGFLTKSTLLHLNIFYIMPYELFKDPIDYTQKYLEIYSRKSTSYELKKIIDYYKKRIRWPLNLNHCFTLIDNNNKKEEMFNNVFGGNATLEIKMKKKYGIWWAEKIFPKGFFWINYLFIKDFIVELSDKYKQDENQRNTD